MKKGFTLIDLLIVIAIIGMVATVVASAFPGAAGSANDEKEWCDSYGAYPVSGIPVKCLKYYGIGSVGNLLK